MQSVLLAPRLMARNLAISDIRVFIAPVENFCDNMSKSWKIFLISGSRRIFDFERMCLSVDQFQAISAFLVAIFVLPKSSFLEKN